MAWHYRVIPQKIEDNCFYLWVDETQDQFFVQEELSVLTGFEIILQKTDTQIIQNALGKYYRKAQGEDAPLILDAKTDFLDRIIQEAKHLGSSDIHIEIFADKARVRIRIDGHLIQRYAIEKQDYPELVNKVKIRANLDISEKRLPQDGRIQYGDFDIRVSILPTLYGEKIVMRILGNDAAKLDIEKIGFNDLEKARYLKGIKKPNGIVLISGPTGSGKTTTLYATLKLLNDDKRNIVTVEDPVEYTLEGINQVQLKESIGLTFASTLRSFLRQDPDVIMLGEIRDSETAQMAIRAALTGHLVLSTIHTNSAWGTISRLIDMGVPSFLLANTMSLSVAQRLVRTLCPNCKRETTQQLEDWPLGNDFKAPEKMFEAVGCETCFYTGYKGRKAIYELIELDRELAEKIKHNEHNVESALKERNILSIAESAYLLLVNGESSLEELYPLLIQEA
jgi:general secretion pathway protein E/type IV pilus assembly protein PilB